MRINYAYEKGSELWVCFNYNGRTYRRPLQGSGGVYEFTFKGKLWRFLGARIY